MARGPTASGTGSGAPSTLPADALALAEQHRLAGRLLEAEAQCRQILAAEPDEPNATHLLGLVAHQAGKLGEAIAQLRRAVALAPDVPLYHANLGEMCRLAGHVDEAIAEGRRAVALKPDYPEALSNLGVALYEQRDFEAAAAHHRRAIALNPGFALAHSNLGNALHSLKRFDEAIAAYRRAIALDRSFADGWSNLGTTLHHAGQYEEGIAALRRAVAIAPNHANAHSGLGILLLMRGDLAEGWDEYEWRLQSSEVKGPRFPQRPWRGESLAGRHIHVQAEQGFGDTIQFARYLPMLEARAGHVSVRVHQSLLTLMRESLPGLEVLGDRGTPAAPIDCECALLSLPCLFKTRLETIPATVPYLRPPMELAERWRRRLRALAGLKVGLVWAGRPEHVNDFRRSVDLATLAPLLGVPGISFASLQLGPRAAALDAPDAPKIAQVLPEHADFAETAGAIAALDLVIAVDTSVAHLAGALGKPTWVLLPSVTDWRWLIGREDNPWYPTMRLFRQQDAAPWADVIARVTAELERVSRGDAAPLTPHREGGERRAAMAAEIIAAQMAAPPPTAPALSPPQALMLAEQHRRAGRLGDAETLSRRAIEAEPDLAEAAHQLGLIAYQSNKLGEAIEHISRAIRLDAGVPTYHANLGEMCRLAGRPEEAIAHGRRALALDPRNPGALSNVGIALFELKKLDEALDHYDRALALSPDFVEAHSNRGNALRALKRLPEAEAAYRRALELKPGFAQAWNNLGTVLRDLKRPEAALEAYRKALAEMPNDPDTLDNLALALRDLDRCDEAVATLRRALAVEARNDKVHLHLGSLLIDQHKVDEAAAAAERALALAPRNHDAVNLMGRIAFERGDLDTALTFYRRALALDPDLADAHNNMGNVLKELGQLPEAQKAFLAAIQIDPSITGVYVNLADSKTFTPGDPHLAAMEALAAKTQGLSKTDRMELDFALAKAYADLADHARSFVHLLAGNAQKRERIAYDEAATMGLFARIEAAFTAERIAAKSGSGEPSGLPIFVLGMPRSGTTLVEQILASHREVFGAGELKTLDEILSEMQGPDGANAAFPEFVAAADGAFIKAIGSRYVAALRRLEPDVKHVTDKMPSNFFFAGIIHLALPNARIIHTVRDPVDTCLSCFSKLFSAEQNHTYDLGELGRYHRRYQALMAYWHRVLPKGRILDVRYEDVVADLEGQARRILDHCGLDWDARCLEFHRTKRPVRTASAAQVRKPIYQGAIGRWRVYEPYLGPLLAELNRSEA
jgi:tetratricopeptide (TPR) repeat protein